MENNNAKNSKDNVTKIDSTNEDTKLMELIKKKDEIEKNLNNKSKIELGEKEKSLLTDELRKMSRMSFLKNRSYQQLELFKDKLEDEKKLFSGVKLSEEEIKLNQINQKIYDIANKKINAINITKNNFNLPESYEDENNNVNIGKKLNAFYKKYKSGKKEENESDLWEIEQKNKANVKKNITNNYDLIIDNQYDVIKNQLISQVENESYSSSYSSSNSDSNTPSPTHKYSNKKVISHKQTSKCKKDYSIEDISPYELSLLKIKAERESLPVFKYKSQIISLLKQHSVIIIQGETGSGKTTQIPQYLVESGFTENNKKIGVTQPRRVAAMSVASRVAYEMNTKIGHEVGYSIRFEDYTSNLTKIKYMTDGIFLREFLTDPLLTSYSVIMIDEAHERTIFTDILLGLLKDLIKVRKDLKLIISSATLSCAKFQNFFSDDYEESSNTDNKKYIDEVKNKLCPIFSIPGRRFPVDIYYSKQPEADYIEASVVTSLQIHLTQELPGDILVFLTGQEEIETAKEMILQRTKSILNKIPKFIVLPIYSALPSEDQAKIFIPSSKDVRKIILATNIAETSITIDGIIYVIDCGFVKIKTFNPRTGLETLSVQPISKASAKQRAGRAGRNRPGKCFRLYTDYSYQNELDDENIPEIQRSNLCSVVLLLKSIGIDNLITFDFIDKPPNEILIRALEQLYALGALNNEGELTKLGRQMAEFPIEPYLSKSIIASANYRCLDQIITIAAMIAVGTNIFYRKNDKENNMNKNNSSKMNSDSNNGYNNNNKLYCDKIRQGFFGFGGDHFTLLNVYNQWEEYDFTSTFCKDNYIHFKSLKKAREIKDQLEQICQRIDIDFSDKELSIDNDKTNENIRKSICSGFFYNSAIICKDGLYRTIKNPHIVNIHPSSSLFNINPKIVVYNELVFTNKEYMKDIIEVNPEWLIEVAPHYYKNVNFGEMLKNNSSKNTGSSTIHY